MPNFHIQFSLCSHIYRRLIEDICICIWFIVKFGYLLLHCSSKNLGSKLICTTNNDKLLHILKFVIMITKLQQIKHCIQNVCSHIFQSWPGFKILKLEVWGFVEQKEAWIFGVDPLYYKCVCACNCDSLCCLHTRFVLIRNK